jgi:RimJ/RimL family protein N-acetyltransferase
MTPIDTDHRRVLPTFVTDRLIVRPRDMADLNRCLAMDRDPAVVRFINGPWSDPVQHHAFVEARIRAKYPEGLGYWSVLGKPDNNFIGWILLIPYELGEAEVEIGWRFVRTAWGQGYATEAALPILHYAFKNVRLDEVIADIDPANLGSVRVAEKLGLRPVRDGEKVQYRLRRDAAGF